MRLGAQCGGRGRFGFAFGYACLVLCWALFSPTPLLAQDRPSKEKLAQYRELIGKALQEYSLGHWPEARVFFMDAHTLWPNARTLRGLGMASYEARDYVEAIGYLEQSLESKTQPLTPKLAREAKSILQQAKRFVSCVYLSVDPEDAQVSMDEQPAQYRPDGTLLLDPGEHSLQVSAAGYDSERRTLHAEAGRDLHVEIVLQSERSQPLAAVQPSSVMLSARPTVPETTQAQAQPPAPQRYVLAGQSGAVAGAFAAVGAAGIVTGWVFYALRNDLRIELWNQGILAEEGQAASFEQTEYRDFQLRGGIALAAGGVGVLALSLAQYFWLPDDESTPAWAWIVGGIGTVIAAGAVLWAVLGEHCEVTDKSAFCHSTASDPLFAPMLGIHALPFITVPLFYLIRARVPENAAYFRVGWTNGSARLSVGGRF